MERWRDDGKSPAYASTTRERMRPLLLRRAWRLLSSNLVDGGERRASTSLVASKSGRDGPAHTAGVEAAGGLTQRVGEGVAQDLRRNLLAAALGESLADFLLTVEVTLEVFQDGLRQRWWLGGFPGCVRRESPPFSSSAARAALFFLVRRAFPDTHRGRFYFPVDPIGQRIGRGESRSPAPSYRGFSTSVGSPALDNERFLRREMRINQKGRGGANASCVSAPAMSG